MRLDPHGTRQIPEDIRRVRASGHGRGRAHVSGNIVELNVRDNQRVKAGDVLFVVDPRPYEAEVERLEAKLVVTDLEIEAYRQSVVAASASLEEAIAESTYASSYLARLEPLLAQKFVTPNEVEKARSDAEASRGRVEAAEAQLKRAQRLVGDEQEAMLEGRKSPRPWRMPD